MSLKVILPWIIAAAAAAGAGGLYLSNNKLNLELSALRADNQALEDAKAAGETNVQQNQGLNDELARLRKDNEELLRLRNEARQLRQEKQQLATQLQNAQAQAAQAQGQPRVWNTATGTLVTGNTNLTPEQLQAQQAFRARYGLATPLTGEQVMINTCINNLRQIDGAKQQWALENKKPDNTLVSAVNITAYLPGNTMPSCPAGGTYTLNAVGVAPICSVPGHTLGK